jgi:recombinational DNA repair ATPase RecF
MFNELSDKLTSEKFELENDIKCLNDWVKLTGANGLQNRLIAAPFSQLKDDMTDYLTKFFKDDVAAAFNVSEKNNSFSFGITRDSKYVEYASLSSGEKCLFTLAMMNCLLKCSGCDLQVIIVDDLLDHLDGDNATQLFDLISSQHGVQYILAGVQPCATASIIQEV